MNTLKLLGLLLMMQTSVVAAATVQNTHWAILSLPSELELERRVAGDHGLFTPGWVLHCGANNDERGNKGLSNTV